MSNESETNKPVERIDIHPIHAAVWRNSGANGTYHSVTFEKRYKDKEGNWHGTQSFSQDDLLLLAKAADKAHDKILELQKDKSWARSVESDSDRQTDAPGQTTGEQSPRKRSGRG